MGVAGGDERMYHARKFPALSVPRTTFLAWYSDSGEPEWSAYSGALGRKFLRLDQFLKWSSAKADENVPNPKLFP
jgi:hypothetical protein